VFAEALTQLEWPLTLRLGSPVPTKKYPWFVAIGASGRQGLVDLRALLRALPASIDAIVLVVVHRPWEQVSRLRDVLARETELSVVVAEEHEQFRAGVVYVGEPSQHLTLAARSFGEITLDPEQRYRNRTVDLLLNSVALHGGRRTVGVILNGSLDDGSRGLAALHHAGMPENAIAYDGPIDFVGDPARIAQAICDAIDADRLVSKDSVLA
jgi:two-component system chemotaxis response regulator CheB